MKSKAQIGKASGVLIVTETLEYNGHGEGPSIPDSNEEECEHPNLIRLPLGGVACFYCKKAWGF